MPTAREAAGRAPAGGVGLRGVSRQFPGDPPVLAVDDVTLDIPAGRIFGIIGASGAGKSTLVRLINGLEPVTSGSIRVGDTEITGLPEHKLRAVRTGIGMIFQQFNLFRSRTVFGNVEYPLRIAGWDAERRRARVSELLGFVGLSGRARAYPEQLSGGQKQRVGIARALATNPALLLADEPTSALDPDTTGEVLRLLRRVNTELGVTIVVITHEMDVVRTICDRVAVMADGRVVEEGEVFDVFAEPRSAVGASFVGSALRDRPSDGELERLHATHPGTLLRVAQREGVGLGVALGGAAARGVEFEIVHGGIQTLQNRAFGSLTLQLRGTPEAVDGLVAEIARRTEVEVL